MAHKYSKWLQLKTAKAITQQDNEWLCSSFNNKTWGRLNKSGLFKLKNYTPKEIIFII